MSLAELGFDPVMTYGAANHALTISKGNLIQLK